jgi:hypothetical protein
MTRNEKAQAIAGTMTQGPDTNETTIAEMLAHAARGDFAASTAEANSCA